MDSKETAGMPPLKRRGSIAAHRNSTDNDDMPIWSEKPFAVKRRAGNGEAANRITLGWTDQTFDDPVRFATPLPHPDRIIHSSVCVVCLSASVCVCVCVCVCVTMEVEHERQKTKVIVDSKPDESDDRQQGPTAAMRITLVATLEFDTTETKFAKVQENFRKLTLDALDRRRLEADLRHILPTLAEEFCVQLLPDECKQERFMMGGVLGYFDDPDPKRMATDVGIWYQFLPLVLQQDDDGTTMALGAIPFDIIRRFDIGSIIAKNIDDIDPSWMFSAFARKGFLVHVNVHVTYVACDLALVRHCFSSADNRLVLSGRTLTGVVCDNRVHASAMEFDRYVEGKRQRLISRVNRVTARDGMDVEETASQPFPAIVVPMKVNMTRMLDPIVEQSKSNTDA